MQRVSPLLLTRGGGSHNRRLTLGAARGSQGASAEAGTPPRKEGRGKRWGQLCRSMYHTHGKFYTVRGRGTPGRPPRPPRQEGPAEKGGETAPKVFPQPRKNFRQAGEGEPLAPPPPPLG